MVRILTAAAVVAALLLVLLGRVIPLPPLVTGEEGSRAAVVQDRTTAIAERYQFQEATLNYQHFLATHALSNLPDELRQEAADLDAGGDRTAVLGEVQSRVPRILDLGHAIYPYADAGEIFFTTLQAYDDALMSWSRTLGPRSEDLRRATWPILEWLKRYPAPIGINPDLQLVPARPDSPWSRIVSTQGAPIGPGLKPPPPPVTTTVTLLDQLAPQVLAPTVDSATIRKFADTADALWVDGYNLPNINSYDDGYFSALRRYDAQSLEVAATPDTPQPSRVRLLAWGAAFALGAVFLSALLLIFVPGAFWRRLPRPRLGRALLPGRAR